MTIKEDLISNISGRTIMLLYILLMTFVIKIKSDTPQICLLCNCSLVKTTRTDFPAAEENSRTIGFNYRAEITEYFQVETKSNTSDQFLYVNCSAEENVGEMDHLAWPTLKIRGIYGNFRNSQWRRLELFPSFIKSQMVKLSLAENSIAEITERDFSGFTRLQMLNISRNVIRQINVTSFSGAKELTKLDLSDNGIERIERQSFAKMNLTYLNLSKNHLTSLTEGFEGLSCLRILDLSGNRLTYLPFNFASLFGSLRYLYIKDNELTQVLKMPPELQSLDLSWNFVDTLRPELVNLQYLDISFNNLTDIEGVFESSPLKVLRARNNSISILPSENIPSLKILDLSYNSLRTVPSAVTSQNLPLLQELYLDGNPISSLKFHQNAPFQDLKVISLSHLANVQNIEFASFQGVLQQSVLNCSNGNGIFLNLSHNNIREIAENAFQDIPICSLDLSYNHIRTLAQSLAQWSQLSYLDLQHNPWLCDCDMQWALDILLPRLYLESPRMLFELRCSSPKRLKSRLFAYWYEAKGRVFCAGPSTIYFGSDDTFVEVWTISMIFCIVLSCIIFILVCTILILLCFRPPPLKKKAKQTAKKKPRTNHYREIRTTINDQYRSSGSNLVGQDQRQSAPMSMNNAV